MRRAILLAAICALTAGPLLVHQAARADGSAGPVYYSNGDVAVATAKCGPGETCATITTASGDQIKILTGGSGHCNPYVLTFMRYVKGQLDAVWSTPTDRNPDQPGGRMSGPKCGGFHNTRMNLEGGVIDMGIFQNRDGTIFVQFFRGSLTKPS
ncbi:MAG TPA: hypothetical protein VN934_12515 [Candidatus Tumulicola sp.]|nr:hypothetical protein [Candidatus Tumulicola sp.]